MSSNWGRSLRLSIFGESHGRSVGVVIDGLPAGLAIDENALALFMARRAPGQGRHTTSRREADVPVIQSGFHLGRTTGTPLCALIENADTRSSDYAEVSRLARPSHADYTGFVRYGGHNDIRGSGHFSGRLTAPLVFAGGVAKQALAVCGVAVGAHIRSIHGVDDAPLDPVCVTAAELDAVAAKPFPVLDDTRGEAMLAEIEAARSAGDSVGGVVECCAVGMPAGVGSPMFDGVENAVASLLFGIPGVRGLEFGDGFASAALRGSENNDPMRAENGRILCETNRHGGVLGGISSGMPLLMRAAFKPTPTIAKEQRTVDYMTGENASITGKGRHDPCIVPRAVPCVESAVALALLELLLEGGNPIGFTDLAR